MPFSAALLPLKPYLGHGLGIKKYVPDGYGVVGMVTLTTTGSPQTYTIPSSGVDAVTEIAVGPGGGGGMSTGWAAGGGGGGGAAVRTRSVSPGQIITATIGQGVQGGTAPNTTVDGGLVAEAGGLGSGYTPGMGGYGSGGDYHFRGARGEPSSDNSTWGKNGGAAANLVGAFDNTPNTHFQVQPEPKTFAYGGNSGNGALVTGGSANFPGNPYGGGGSGMWNQNGNWGAAGGQGIVIILLLSKTMPVKLITSAKEQNYASAPAISNRFGAARYIPSSHRIIGIHLTTTLGAQTYTVPAGVDAVLEIAQAGGGGGGSASNGSTSGNGGGGGGAGVRFRTVSQGQSIAINVGAAGTGGVGGSTGHGSNGGNTSIDGLVATGGQGAVANNDNGGARALGGYASGGDAHFFGYAGARSGESAQLSGDGGAAADYMNFSASNYARIPKVPLLALNGNANAGRGGASVSIYTVGQPGSDYGAGGSGGHSTYAGGNGSQGFAMIILLKKIS